MNPLLSLSAAAIHLSASSRETFSPKSLKNNCNSSASMRWSRFLSYAWKNGRMTSATRSNCSRVALRGVVLVGDSIFRWATSLAKIPDRLISPSRIAATRTSSMMSSLTSEERCTFQ
ncbi:hypothetical protein F442_18948 [Phytophthora nicotianae P10297]|uniref:Uncharacterized protein n=1 Tax=Phytophthora nicotianae P10297 TaxID=1317064 RepID=W2YDS3_PHYNI|nr:hypothetical protein F442_18948 [Phytophthora nicotianae P10297]